MIYLDTHVAVWLYAGEHERLSARARALINAHDLFVSPMVLLEIQYLFEIDRIAQKAQSVIAGLSKSIGLKVCDANFHQVIACAERFSWTRDPFDRIIVANAALNNHQFLTRDQTILTHFKQAVW